jgi:hypothetical protein
MLLVHVTKTSLLPHILEDGRLTPGKHPGHYNYDTTHTALYFVLLHGAHRLAHPRKSQTYLFFDPAILQETGGELHDAWLVNTQHRKTYDPHKPLQQNLEEWDEWLRSTMKTNQHHPWQRIFDTGFPNEVLIHANVPLTPYLVGIYGTKEAHGPHAHLLMTKPRAEVIPFLKKWDAYK